MTREELIAEIRNLRSQVARLASQLPNTGSESQPPSVRLDPAHLPPSFVRSLRRSEQRFHTCLDNMLDCFAIFSSIRDADGRIVDFRYDYINPAGCRSNGRPLEDHIGRTLLELLPGHRTCPLFDAYRRVVETGESVELESIDHAVRSDPQHPPRVLDVRAWKLDDGLAVAWRDITRRKHAEENLRHLTHHARCCLWQGTVTGLPGWDTPAGLDYDRHLFQWTVAIQDVDATRAVIDVQQHPQESYEAASLRSRLPGETQRMWRTSAAALQRNRLAYEQEFRCRDRHGRVHWLYENVTVQPLAPGHWQVFGAVMNISERKKAEEALQDSEQRYRFLVETTSDWVWAVDRNGCYTYSSPKVKDLLGYEPGEILGRKPFEFMPPEESARVGQLFEEAARSGRPIRELENVNLHKDGRLVVLETSGEPIFDDAGNFAGYHGVDRDITRRKHAEEALRAANRQAEESLARLQAVVESMTDALIIADPAGNLAYHNPASMALHGYRTPQEACRPAGQLARFWEIRDLDGRLLPPADWPISRALRGQRYTQLQANVRRTDTGLEFIGCYNGTPVYDRDGRMILAIVTIRDITPIKQAEQQLKELNATLEQRVAERTAQLHRRQEDLRRSEEILATAQRIAHLGSWDYDHVNDVLRWSDETYRIFGVDRASFMPTLAGFLDMIHPDDRQRVQHAIRRSESKKVPYSVEHRIRRPDGTERIIHEEGRFFYDDTGRGVRSVGMALDITERKQAQAAAELYSRRIRQLAVKLSLAEEQERRRLAAVLHDDLVQVLVAIRMKFAALRHTTDQPARDQQIAEIEALVLRVTHVARSLMSQMSHRTLYELGFVPAAQWLAEDIKGLYGLKVILADDGQPKPIAEPVRVLLYQCLREALVNAAKHAQVQEARVHILRDGPIVRVIVEDSGIGFDPSAIDPKPEGGGFGLFSIEERLEPLGGKVDINSAPGHGTTVVLEVPANPAPTTPSS